MQKRKVLFVVHQLNYGGVQKALISALNAIDYETNEVTLYVRKNRTELLPEVNPKVSKILINDDITRYYRKPYAVLLQLSSKVAKLFGLKEKMRFFDVKLKQYIVMNQMRYERQKFFPETMQYDVAVAYIQGYPAQFVAEYVNAARKIMFYHGSTDEHHKLHEQIMPYFDAIVGVSRGVQEVLSGLYPRFAGKMLHLDNYVDASEIRKKAEIQKVEVPEDSLILCSCGRFAPIKGFDLAVDAARILMDRGMNFRWYFVGDGPERANLEHKIENLGVEGQVEITGMQSNPYPWIAAADLYVQPSREEAQPMSILEAQVLCKPVVSTKTVGGLSLVQDGVNGALAEINGASLAKKIGDLYDNDNLRSKMKCELENADHTKDFKMFCQKWAELLKG